jgi:hypothetical protein
MATKDEVDSFLRDFKAKMKVFDIVFRDDRGKNAQTLADLELRPLDRISIIESLCSSDYCEGPVPDLFYRTPGMWMFGKQVKGREVYIKVSPGHPDNRVICISFHLAEHPLDYPLKDDQS